MKKISIILMIMLVTIFSGCYDWPNNETGTWSQKGEEEFTIKIKSDNTYKITRKTDSFKGTYEGTWIGIYSHIPVEDGYHTYTFTDKAGVTFYGKLPEYGDNTLELFDMKGFGFGFDKIYLYE